MYLLNGNTSITTTQTVPAFDHVHKPELLETPVTLLKSSFSTPILDRQIETSTIVQRQTSASILENERFLDTMLRKVYYTTCKKDSIIKLQKTAERIFNVELEQFKAKSGKTLSDSHALCQEQVQSLKEAC